MPTSTPSPSWSPPLALARLDRFLTAWMARRGVSILRSTIGILFLWFGSIKLVPGLSSEYEICVRTLGTLSFGRIPPEVAIVMAATCECLIGAGLTFRRHLRFTLLLLFAHMTMTFVALGLFHREMFVLFPLAPTLQGQYIMKNVILLCAGLVIGATVGGEDTPERDGIPATV